MTTDLTEAGPPGAAPGTAADLFLAEAAALATRRAALVAEAWARAEGRFTPDEVFARIELQRVDAELRQLGVDARLVLAIADVNSRLAKMEAAEATGGAA